MKAAKAEPQETALEKRAMGWPEKARSLQIIDQASRDRASEDLRGIKALRDEIEGVFGDLVRKAHAAHQAALVARKKVEDPLIQAEGIVKRVILDFDNEQERLRLEEQQRLQAEEDRRAEVQRQKDLKKLERQGASKQELKMAAAQPITAPTVYVAPAITGDEGKRDNWNIEVTNIGMLIKFAASRPEFGNLLLPNTTALRSMARAQKGMMKVPGVRVFNDKVLVQR